MSDLDEYFGRLSNFDALSGLEQTEALLYLVIEMDGARSATGSRIEEVRQHFGLAKGKARQHLANHTKKDGSGRFLKRAVGYALHPDRVEFWRKQLAIRKTAIETAKALREHLDGVGAGVMRDYLEEAVGCFEARFFRASMVMAWCAGYSVLREWIFTRQLGAFNSQFATWNKPRTLASIDQFDEMSERTVIDTCRDAKIVAKSTHKILVALLDQRNSYAHPSGRTVSEPVAEAFIQQTVDEVVKRFS